MGDTELSDETGLTRIRPNSSLFRQGLISAVIFVTTVFVVLYALTIPNGPWPLVLGIQVILMLALTGASVGYFNATIWVGPQLIIERGFFGFTRRYGADQIDSVLLVTTISAGGESLRQLFVRDAGDHHLVRMRGQFWSNESFDEVVRILDVPVVSLGEATTIRDLRTLHPNLLFWFERHPARAIAAIAGCAVVMGAALFALLRLIGVG